MGKKRLKWYDWIASLLVAIALINWPLVDLLNFNLVEWITFGVSWLATIIYVIVGVVGVIFLGKWLKALF